MLKRNLHLLIPALFVAVVWLSGEKSTFGGHLLEGPLWYLKGGPLSSIMGLLLTSASIYCVSFGTKLCVEAEIRKTTFLGMLLIGFGSGFWLLIGTLIGFGMAIANV